MSEKESLSSFEVESVDGVRNRYEQWSASYENDVRGWGYTLPEDLADRLVRSYAGGLVLDAGCGTGLVGHALVDRGISVTDLVGVDLSPSTLDLAAGTGSYRALVRGDLNRQLPFRDETFGAVACGGVLTYLPDTEATLREFLRVCFAGAVIVVSQRTDRWAERGDDKVMARLRADGVDVQVHDPLPYLPDLAEYGTAIEVIFVTLRR